VIFVAFSDEFERYSSLSQDEELFRVKEAKKITRM